MGSLGRVGLFGALDSVGLFGTRGEAATSLFGLLGDDPFIDNPDLGADGSLPPNFDDDPKREESAEGIYILQETPIPLTKT